jgi:hypothetical protein
MRSSFLGSTTLEEKSKKNGMEEKASKDHYLPQPEHPLPSHHSRMNLILQLWKVLFLFLAARLVSREIDMSQEDG